MISTVWNFSLSHAKKKKDNDSMSGHGGNKETSLLKMIYLLPRKPKGKILKSQ